MALDFGASFANELSAVLPIEARLAARAPVPAAHMMHVRQSNGTTGNDTADIFLDSSVNARTDRYAASIVSACADQTVYVLQSTCTSGQVFTSSCGPSAPVLTVTQGPSTYRISTELTTTTRGTEVRATVMESCILAGTTAATCTAILGGAVGTETTSRTTTSTLTGTRYWRTPIPITGGAEKTRATPLASCTAAPSTSLSTAAAPAATTRGVAILGLVGAVGAGAILQAF